MALQSKAKQRERRSGEQHGGHEADGGGARYYGDERKMRRLTRGERAGFGRREGGGREGEKGVCSIMRLGVGDDVIYRSTKRSEEGEVCGEARVKNLHGQKLGSAKVLY